MSEMELIESALNELAASVQAGDEGDNGRSNEDEDEEEGQDRDEEGED